MSSHQPKHLLIMGLTASTEEDHKEWSIEATLAAVADEKAKLSNLNISMEMYQIDPALSLSKYLSDVKTLLHSNAYDGVSIGFGVRGDEKFTDVFTGLVNLIVEEGKTSEGKPPKLLFALRPDGLVETVQGVWPEYA